MREPLARSQEFGPIAIAFMIAVLAGLFAVGLPMVQHARKHARRATLQSAIRITGSDGGLRTIVDYDSDLIAPPLIEACLAELEADDA